MQPTHISIIRNFPHIFSQIHALVCIGMLSRIIRAYLDSMTRYKVRKWNHGLALFSILVQKCAINTPMFLRSFYALKKNNHQKCIKNLIIIIVAFLQSLNFETFVSPFRPKMEHCGLVQFSLFAVGMVQTNFLVGPLVHEL